MEIDKAEILVDEGGTYMIIPGEYVLTEEAMNANAVESGYGTTGVDILSGNPFSLDVDNITLPNGKPFAKQSTNSKGETIWVIRGQHKQLISNDMGDRFLVLKNLYLCKSFMLYQLDKWILI